MLKSILQHYWCSCSRMHNTGMSKPLRATISLLCTDGAKLYKLQNLFEFWVSATSSCDTCTCNGVSCQVIGCWYNLLFRCARIHLLILTGFEDAYYEEPGLIVIPEGQEHEHAGKSAFLDLITGAPFKVTWWKKLVCVW